MVVPEPQIMTAMNRAEIGARTPGVDYLGHALEVVPINLVAPFGTQFSKEVIGDRVVADPAPPYGRPKGNRFLLFPRQEDLEPTMRMLCPPGASRRPKSLNPNLKPRSKMRPSLHA